MGSEKTSDRHACRGRAGDLGTQTLSVSVPKQVPERCLEALASSEICADQAARVARGELHRRMRLDRGRGTDTVFQGGDVRLKGSKSAGVAAQRKLADSLERSEAAQII